MTQSKPNKNQDFFSYEKIQQAVVNGRGYLQTAIKAGEYSGALMESFYDISINEKPELKKPLNNFKMHIAINDVYNEFKDPNLERGYNITDQILRNNRVFHYKVVCPGIKIDQHPDQLYQARKQVTVYSGEEGCNRSLAEWERVMDEITLAFIDQGIEPKPELIGEQDVRVKGSKYITYRCDKKYDVILELRRIKGNENELERGFGCPYKDIEKSVDPLQGMRLSDTTYKKILDVVNKVAVSHISKTAEFGIIVAIGNIIRESVKQDGIREANIKRMYEHVVNNTHIDLDKRKIIVRALLMQVPIKENASNDDISSQISNYETYTSYSKAAAEYNQLILDVCEKIKENGKLPYWLSNEDKKLYSVALQWQEMNSQWESRHKKFINSQPDKVAVLTSNDAIKAYKDRMTTIANLVKHDYIADQIDLISSTNNFNLQDYKTQGDMPSNIPENQSMEYDDTTETHGNIFDQI